MSDRPVILEYTHDGRAARLTLNRPNKNNAIDRALLETLTAQIEDIERANDVRVVTVRGAGGTFSAGADLAELKGTIEDGDRAGAAAFLDLIHETLDRLAAVTVPTVAIVEGFALAGGLETMLACDLTICSRDATLGDQHANFGLVAGGGGTQRLPRIVGPRRAKELIFTGRRLSPVEAKEWGLVNRVADPDDLDDAIEDLVDILAEKSGRAAGVAKYLVDRGADLDMETGLELEREQVCSYMFEDDAKEGLRAFADGRAPEF
ncbi:enoyl-CoA hydratase/isomerase family protein [Natronomonas gomsonensis]|uniref:enoyl-CoA hydratase/isomerase family protein n=1 Tax=Natronomonas gomsonensis TaxID=1046043 RepID=UPI0020CA2BA9|nr:enoyl-CoA hydratase/isomerase family protein [Natronomonas gomsonensis]MCY4729919.1 enoyl-CoA hydratase/isomerase family protein [Natronomonas gomsonensis]